MTVGGMYLTVEYLLVIALMSLINADKIQYTQVILVFTEIIFVTLFMAVGVSVAASDRSHSDTFLYPPFLVGVVPTFILFGLKKFFTGTIASEALTTFVGAPLIAGILWLTLALYGVERRRLFLGSLTFVCYFFAVPIGVLGPMSAVSSSFKYLNTLGMILIYIGLGLIGSAGLFKMIVFVRTMY
jgi:hypothetical protein